MCISVSKSDIVDEKRADWVASPPLSTSPTFVSSVDAFHPSMHKALTTSHGSHNLQNYPFKPFSTAYVNEALRTEVDWRTKGLVTPAKDQGAHGYCGTFGRTAAAEGQYARLAGHGASCIRDPNRPSVASCSTLSFTLSAMEINIYMGTQRIEVDLVKKSWHDAQLRANLLHSARQHFDSLDNFSHIGHDLSTLLLVISLTHASMRRLQVCATFQKRSWSTALVGTRISSPTSSQTGSWTRRSIHTI